MFAPPLLDMLTPDVSCGCDRPLFIGSGLQFKRDDEILRENELGVGVASPCSGLLLQIEKVKELVLTRIVLHYHLFLNLYNQRVSSGI